MAVDMARPLRRRAIFAFTTLGFGLLGGCDTSQTEPITEPIGVRREAPKYFSAEEKRAARTLSIGNNSTLDDIKDQSKRALLCAVAVEALIERLRESGALNPEQLRLLQSLPSGYRRKAQAAGGKSEADLSNDEREIRAANDSPAELGRTGIACIQRLQDSIP